MRAILIALILVSLPALADSTMAYSQSSAQAQAGAVAGAFSGGNTFQGGSTSYKEQKQAPAVFAPSIAPTAPCMGGTSAGGAGTGFGLSFGTSWTDDECNTRETARMFQGMGMMSDALAVLCSSAYAAAAPSCAGRARACHADAIVAQRLGVEVCP
ncbi:MAG: hypothetical protein KAX65_00945 [Caldilineaceae bacterium]|nr:hypothetical protein [Caldilineaceae bacterium]